MAKFIRTARLTRPHRKRGYMRPVVLTTGVALASGFATALAGGIAGNQSEADGIGLGLAIGASANQTVGLASGYVAPDGPVSNIAVGASEADIPALASGSGTASGGGGGGALPDQADAVGAALWSETGTATGSATAIALSGGSVIAVANGTATASAFSLSIFAAAGTGAAIGISLPNNAATGMAAGIGAAPGIPGDPVIATATGLGTAPGVSLLHAASTGLSTGAGQANALYKRLILGWGQAERKYDPKLLEPKPDPIKEAMAARERARLALLASRKQRFDVAYRDAWKVVRADKGPQSQALRSLLHLVAKYKDSGVDLEPLIEILELSKSARSARDVNSLSRRLERVLPVLLYG